MELTHFYYEISVNPTYIPTFYCVFPAFYFGFVCKKGHEKTFAVQYIIYSGRYLTE